MTNVQNEYRPDFVTPPGETLAEVLEAKSLSQADLAERTGRPKKTINEIIRGKAAITPDTAIQLEHVLGVPAVFWITREAHYRQHLATKQERASLQKHVGWIKKFPLARMIRAGWLEKRELRVDQLRELLGFFGIASPDQFDDLYRDLECRFRTTQRFEISEYALAAWLREGERRARAMPCRPFDRKRLLATIESFRALTLEPVKMWNSQLSELGAGCGVAIVVVPPLPKIRASGATRWLSPRKAMIQMSLRYKSNDHFWFTFFHEIGHILLHGKKELFLEPDTKQRDRDQVEVEANEFAAETLIPTSAFRNFTNRIRFSKKAILSFADAIGVAPGIVVGRLQHDGLLPFSHCNDLKDKIDQADLLPEPNL